MLGEVEFASKGWESLKGWEMAQRKSFVRLRGGLDYSWWLSVVVIYGFTMVTFTLKEDSLHLDRVSV